MSGTTSAREGYREAGAGSVIGVTKRVFNLSHDAPPVLLDCLGKALLPPQAGAEGAATQEQGHFLQLAALGCDQGVELC
jgi:hypothetical protein